MVQSLPWQTVQELLNQPLGVLGTNRLGHAYTSLVAFAATPDARNLYFVTTRATRKFRNLIQDKHVAMLIDNRSHRTRDFYEASAISAYGRATEVSEEERPQAVSLYLDKHPQLKDFVLAPSTVLLRMSVDTYHLVERFQHVTEFRMDQCTT